jgi:hypothetical protein
MIILYLILVINIYIYTHTRFLCLSIEYKNIKTCVLCWLGGCQCDFRANNHGLNTYSCIILAFYYLNVGENRATRKTDALI